MIIMKENEKIDFFDYGTKFAKETKLMILAKAREIEKEYGKKARIDFENGCAAYFPIFEENSFDDEVDISNGIRGIREKDYGVDNWRNNSYFDDSGISRQYITNSSGKKVYNQPKKRK